MTFSSSSSSSTVQPSLPPLYFAKSLTTCSSEQATTSSAALTTAVLPAEVLHRCLVEYADWGDLARLAAVQTAWSTIMYDAAQQSPAATWELSQALLDGTAGLAPNPAQSMKLMLQLTNLSTSTTTTHTDTTTTTIHTDTIYTNDNTPTCGVPNEFSARAMKKIAQCYLNGTGVETANATLGLQWLEAAHVIGHDVDAAHEIALIYEHGQYAVPCDVVKAVDWFRTAAEAGHVEAMAELGLCYELGLAVQQSDEIALEWYIKAAEGGNLTAKYAVGEAFEEARGVPQSDAEACLWYYRAAIEGDEDSRKALRRLEAIARIVLPGVGKLLDE